MRYFAHVACPGSHQPCGSCDEVSRLDPLLPPCLSFHGTLPPLVDCLGFFGFLWFSFVGFPLSHHGNVLEFDQCCSHSGRVLLQQFHGSIFQRNPVEATVGGTLMKGGVTIIVFIGWSLPCYFHLSLSEQGGFCVPVWPLHGSSRICSLDSLSMEILSQSQFVD